MKHLGAGQVTMFISSSTTDPVGLGKRATVVKKSAEMGLFSDSIELTKKVRMFDYNIFVILSGKNSEIPALMLQIFIE